MVNGVSDVAEYGKEKIAGRESTLTKLFDRGYGYIYLHSDELFSTTSTHLGALVKGIASVAAGRRLSETERVLQTLDDGVASAAFECDDTLFECQPVCVRLDPAT